MLNDSTLSKLISSFVQKGGRIDKYYLREGNKGKRALVHLDGWFSGKSVRDAIQKAFGKI